MKAERKAVKAECLWSSRSCEEGLEFGCGCRGERRVQGRARSHPFVGECPTKPVRFFVPFPSCL